MSRSNRPAPRDSRPSRPQAAASRPMPDRVARTAATSPIHGDSLDLHAWNAAWNLGLQIHAGARARCRDVPGCRGLACSRPRGRCTGRRSTWCSGTAPPERGSAGRRSVPGGCRLSGRLELGAADPELLRRLLGEHSAACGIRVGRHTVGAHAAEEQALRLLASTPTGQCCSTSWSSRAAPRDRPPSRRMRQQAEPARPLRGARPRTDDESFTAGRAPSAPVLAVGLRRLELRRLGSIPVPWNLVPLPWLEALELTGSGYVGKPCERMQRATFKAKATFCLSPCVPPPPPLGSRCLQTASAAVDTCLETPVSNGGKLPWGSGPGSSARRARACSGRRRALRSPAPTPSGDWRRNRRMRRRAGPGRPVRERGAARADARSR